MLLREYKEMVESIPPQHKVTNTLLGRVLNTSSQNISKRIKNNSELTTSELTKLEAAFGVFRFETEISNSNSLSLRSTNFDEEFSTWGTRLQKVQAKNGLSDNEMARLLNISHDLWSEILCNEANPSIDLIKTIVAKFDVDLNWLFLAQSPQKESTTNSDVINSLSPDKFSKLMKLIED